jgi:hypothetical protein
VIIRTSVILQLRGLLLIVNQRVAEAEKQIAAQQRRIQELETMGLPAVEEKKTLDVMQVLASTMRDNRLVIEWLISGTTEH